MAQKLDSIIREALIENGHSTPHQYLRYLQYAIDTLKDLHLDVTGVAKFIAIPINSNGTADLPPDYISELGVYICGTDGNLHPLGRNRKMCPPSVDDCGDTLANSGTGTGIFASNDNDHYKNGENLGRYFGIGGGQNAHGYYDIDETNGFIKLQSFSGSSIWLEYLADLERNANGEYEVSPYIEEAIKAGIFWRSVRRNSQKSGQEKQMAFADYKMEKDKAHRRISSFTIEEAKSVIRRSFNPTAKT